MERRICLRSTDFDGSVLGGVSIRASLKPARRHLRVVDFSRDASADAGRTEAVPEPPRNPVSRIGDQWILRDHRLLCGDSTCDADNAAVIGGLA